MSREQWQAVDDYFAEHFGGGDAALEATLEASRAAGLPSIQVSPAQGKLLHIWAKSIGARRILEIGTLGGYSTIWLARALPGDGRLITLEVDPRHAEVARANLARAGLDRVVEIRLGRALDTLATLAGPFDLVFIDADKPSNAEYFGWALKLTRPGGVIFVDNVVRQGAVADPRVTNPEVEGVRRFVEMLSREPRVTATAIQTVGSKGYDGFAVAVVN